MISFGQALLFAFLGGMLLNLMPCVLPVLAVKTTALAGMGEDSFGRRLRHGLGYSAGILFSMLVLAGVVIGFQQAGKTIGWGFQFQQPLYVAILAAVIVLFALNLFGIFQIGVPKFASGLAGDDLEGDGRSFFEGILAVVLATPCTAPFMGTAIGFAMTSSPPVIATTFVSLGAGLAAPFVAVALMPQFQSLLPSPGPWMGTMKKVLGFVLLGTALWLVWLFGRHLGLAGVTGLLGFLIALSFSAWLFGEVQYRPVDRVKIAGFSAAVVVAVAGGWFGVEATEGSIAESLGNNAAAAASAEQSGDDQRASADLEITWEEWTPTVVEENLEEGRPVFVNFTADWCISCKANEREVFTEPEVIAAGHDADLTWVKADLTQTDDRLVEELERFGRTGVPLYLVYSPDSPDDPEILPQVLTEDRILEEFGALY